MLGEGFLVDARLVVIALEMRVGDELDKVAIAQFVFCEEDEVVVDIAPPAGRGFLFEPAAGGDVDFAADNRLDALLHGGLEKIDGSEQHAVVGDGEGGEFEVVGAVHQLVDAAGRIEQRVFGV